MARPTAATRQIAFINFAHGATHYSQLILATAVLGMLGRRAPASARNTGRCWRSAPPCSWSMASSPCPWAGWPTGSGGVG
ncbi:hypothetical protein ACFQU7_14175 [Pseudoroseomonas wenyumeiae]